MKKRTLNLLILNLIIAVSIWSLYFYFIRHIKIANDALGDIRYKVVFAMKKEQAIANLKNRVQDNFKDGLDLNEFLIRGDETAEIVQKIEGFGPISGTRIETKSVAIEPATEMPEGVEFVRIMANIDGTKTSVLKSIQLIEGLPYNIKINKISLVRSGDASSTVKWTTDIDLVLVKLKEAQN